MSGTKADRPAGNSEAIVGQRRGRRRWLAVFAGLCVLGGGGAVFCWREGAPARQIQITLPPLPDLTGRPAALRDRLTTANARAAVKSRPNPSDVAELARLYHANGYLEEAEACWRWLRTAEPQEAKWCYYLADLRRTAGDYDGDEALLNETVKRAPDYAPAWLQLGQLQFKSGRLDQAHDSYERRLALVPGDPYARLGLARIALQQNHPENGRRMLEQLVHDAPKFPPSLNLYAEILATAGEQEAATKQRFLAAAAGRYREADDPWLEQLHAWCYEPKRLAVLGTIDFQTNYGDLGRGYLERAMALSPGDSQCAEALSSLYLKLGDVAKARTLLEQVIPTVKPPDPILYVNLCETARLSHHSEEALQMVDQALARLPEAYQLHNERGAILGDLVRLEESAQAYRRAIALAPTDTDSNYSLGITLLALGRREDAVAYIKRSLTLQPSFPKALFTLGRMELEAGNLDGAAVYLKPLYELHQDQEMARQLMAQWYLQAGLAAAKKHDSVAAEQNYRAGFAIDPANPILDLNLGTLYLLQSRPADAVAPLEAYHRVKSADPQGLLFLGQAYAQVGRVPEARRALLEGEQLATKAGNTETAGYCREILNQM